MFKRTLVAASCVAAMTFSAAANAAILQVDGTGTVSFLNTGLAGNTFFDIGDGISFSITYDDSIADTNADPAVGDYDAILSYALTIGTYSITSSGDGISVEPNDVISDRVFFNDAVSAHTANSGQVSGFDVETSRVLIQDGTSNALTNDALLGLVLDPTVFSDSIAQIFFTGLAGVGVGGEITTFSVTDITSEVPLPAAAPLMVLGLAGMRLVNRRKKRG